MNLIVVDGKFDNKKSMKYRGLTIVQTTYIYIYKSVKVKEFNSRMNQLLPAYSLPGHRYYRPDGSD